MNGELGFWTGLRNSFTTQSIAYVLGSMFAVLAVFPAYFADRIRSGLNKANARGGAVGRSLMPIARIRRV
jgi:hypothetical protein